MSGTNGHSEAGETRWSGLVLAFEDVRRLNGHRAVLLEPGTIVTPLAADELKLRGVEVRRETAAQAVVTGAVWGYAQDRAHPAVRSAVAAAERDGIRFRELATSGESPCRWAKEVAECVARGECAGGVLFCADPGLVCCVANKVAGLRAVAVTTVNQAARATLTLGANLLAVEMPGRTFFEVRQMFRVLCSTATCPDGVASTLRELDGHAHR